MRARDPMAWQGVMPAITTPFSAEDAVDHAFLDRHCRELAGAGCTAIVALGSLGEGGALTSEEKRAVLRTCVAAAGPRTPVVAAVGAIATRDAVALARDAAALGCRGLMVLPPYLHRGRWSEARAHFAAVLDATELSCMLYNNPIAYGTDVDPEAVAELAGAHPTLRAVKESSADVRRITAIRALAGDDLALLVGVDDLIVEGVGAGAIGWVAGLVNALPRESVALFELARQGRTAAAAALYRWFLPLLRLDTVPDFVQRIKLVQQEVGLGSERVRAPRQPLAGEERERALSSIREALSARPKG